MRHRPIIDAGPSLNFFSIHKERLLFRTLGPLSAPETVRDEVARKSRQDPRFRAAERVWQRIPDDLLRVLSDDVTPELEDVVSRISHLPMQERRGRSKDLGETMVIAHAVVAAESGREVIVLIDDGSGARIASSEARRLDRLKTTGRPVGRIRLVNTLAVLESAARKRYVADRTAMRDLYEHLRGLDDGLPPIATTKLLSSDTWR